VRRLAAIAAVLAVAVAVGAVALAVSGGSGDGYRVRAIFDTAFGVIPGEEVRVAGVTVGTVGSLHVTPEKKAAVVLDIDRPGFGDFRRDASCIVRPQSLIGERYVECTPTQPRPDGQPAPPALRRIAAGAGAGEYLLPVTNTQRSVDLDLINDVYRLPQRQRLTIILNELGTGLAGRGADLNAVIRRADPALEQTDRVLAVLKQQNQVLANLATQSDRVLAPLAQRRAQVADFVAQARNVSVATAQKRGALAQSLRKLPVFLRELRPTLVRLGQLSDQMTPVLSDLGSQATSVDRLVTQLGPLARAARPAVSSLGEASKVGTKAVRAIRPITSDVNDLATSAGPLASDLSGLLTSLRDTGGVERIMDYLFFQMASINGFDSAGHYLRAALLINPCSTYAVRKTIGCEATFSKADATAGSAGDQGRSLPLRRQDALANGMSLRDVLRAYPSDAAQDARAATQRATVAAAARRGQTAARAGQAPIAMPSALLPGSATTRTVPRARATAAATTAADPDTASTSASDDATGRLLDYLLGDGS
jgi:phospholipid/cholesterol/gamma-HCH transport system substrate-binding protein